MVLAIFNSVHTRTSNRMGDWWEHVSLVKLHSPTSIYIVAPSYSGKTVVVKNILKQAECVFTIPPVKTFACYSVDQLIYDEMKKHRIS